MKKKTGPPAVEVTSADQAKELIVANNVIIFGFFSDQSSTKAKAFLGVASAVDDQVFAIVSDEKVIGELEAEDEDIVLFKNVSNLDLISVILKEFYKVKLKTKLNIKLIYTQINIFSDLTIIINIIRYIFT